MRRKLLKLSMALALAVAPGLAPAQAIAPLPRPAAPQGDGWISLPRPPAEMLADRQRLAAALDKLPPERKGVVDAYVVVLALDTDPVFGREAREAGRVLARRFDAAGRTLVLADDEGGARADAAGTPEHLALALARVAERMNEAEDVLVLYTTSHGVRGSGLAYKDRARGGGVVSPARLAAMIDTLGIRNRLVIVQACYAGQFVPALASPTSIVATAASAAQPSFGCAAGNDWTFYGDALVNRALRKPAPLATQLARAGTLVAGWEASGRLKPSQPQVSMGAQAARWLAPLERRAPKRASRPVGRSPDEIGR